MDEQRLSDSAETLWQNTAPLSATSSGEYSQVYESDTQPRYTVKVRPATDVLPRPHPQRRPWLAPLLFLLLLIFVAGNVLLSLRAARIGVRAVALPASDFAVGVRTTLNVRDDSGRITIHTGIRQLITVRATVDQDIFGTRPGINYNQQGDTFNIGITQPPLSGLSTSDVALDITVPVAINLALDTDTANITIADIQGQVNVQDNSGSVNISDAILSGNGTIKTGAGNVSLNCKFANGAQYQTKTASGAIALTLLAGTRTHIEASSASGTINSTIQSLKTSSDSSGQQANGDIGGANPPSSLSLESTSGPINIDAAS